MKPVLLLVGALLQAGPHARPAAPPATPAPAATPSEWPGESFPLPLTVATPQDLAFKQAAEREYLVFNLLAGGKLAFDQGAWAEAAAKWERLLALPGLSAELSELVKPWAKVARERAGGNPAAAVEVAKVEPPAAERPAPVAASVVTVSGVVTGGGSGGPGGAVVMLHRADGSTPRPRPLKKAEVTQKMKRFFPGVLAVTAGTHVRFANNDDIFHSVFSLSKPNDFDLGLYKSGEWRDQAFDVPGPVQLLCNIHSSMSAWLYVVDTPWFAQADAGGRFSVAGVPPGTYKLTVWHPRAAHVAERTVKVHPGMDGVTLAVDGDKPQPAFVPDKYGKPRQPQLGY